MKTLLLARHARSDPAEAGQADHHRPLNARGRLDASRMGQRLAGRSVRLDTIVASPAARARATAELMAAELGFDLRSIRYVATLYNANGDAILDEVVRLDDTLGCAMIVAHNPGLTELAHRFSPGVTNMPAGAVGGFRLPAESWADLRFRRPDEFLFEQPEEGEDR